MDHIHHLLSAHGFTRTRLAKSKPIVVHAIAGSGKSTVIRKILSDLPNAKAYTLGKPDPYSLSNPTIKAFAQFKRGTLDILDEYGQLPLTDLDSSFEFIFTDPYQAPTDNLFEPHYTLETTYRFGPNTCNLLNQAFQSNITSLVTKDNISFGSPYLVDPVGTILAFQPDTYLILCLHQASFFKVSDVIGYQWPVVTLYLACKISEIPEEERHLLFIGLTRHTESLLILGPDAFDSSP